jgi:hypothetical protein
MTDMIIILKQVVEMKEYIFGVDIGGTTYDKGKTI